MRQERHAGYEVKALSNLIRRKVWELSGQPECDAFTEMQGMLLGFLCHNRDQEIFQKDLEEAFYIRRSTASRLLKRLEEEGFVMRCSVSRDARLKQVMATPKAEALNQQIASRITQVEAALTKGIGAEELQQFMMTIAKMKQNLMENWKKQMTLTWLCMISSKNMRQSIRESYSMATDIQTNGWRKPKDVVFRISNPW